MCIRDRRHTGCKNAVIGLSGGLDSTLALLVTIRAFDQLNLDRKGIVSVTMPCFGTTNRTYDNAVKLAQELGTTLKEISIEKAVLQLSLIHIFGERKCTVYRERWYGSGRA